MNSEHAQRRNQPGQSLNAVLLYDDFDAAARAKCAMERAARLASKATTCSIKPWRIDALKRGAADDEVLADAAGADVVLLVLHRCQTVPRWVMAWLERWAECRQVREPALALQRGDVQPPLLDRELRQFAERHGVSWLQSGDQSFEDDSAQFVQTLHRRETATTPTLQCIMTQPTHFLLQPTRWLIRPTYLRWPV